MFTCTKPGNTIDINGVYNTVPMKDVPQGANPAELILFIVTSLQKEGYRGVRVSSAGGEDTIYYKHAPEGTLKSANGYYVNCDGEETSRYVRLVQE